MSNHPPWLHGNISRSAAAALLFQTTHVDESNIPMDGVFLVRQKQESGNFVLSVIFGGKDTHHLVEAHNADSFIINKNRQFVVKGLSISDFVEKLSQRNAMHGWPVQLLYPVHRKDEMKESTVQQMENQDNAQHTSVDSDYMKEVNDHSQKMCHEKHETARQHILIQETPTPLHNNISLSIRSVIVMQAHVKGFLTRQRIKTGRLKVRRPWLHGAISKQEAEIHRAILVVTVSWIENSTICFTVAYVVSERIRESQGGIQEGKYLVRSRPKHPGQYVLVLVANGNFTHHLIKPDGNRDTYLINRQYFGRMKTLDDVVYILRKMDDIEGWPVPLKCYVKSPHSDDQDVARLVAGKVLVGNQLVSEKDLESEKGILFRPDEPSSQNTILQPEIIPEVHEQHEQQEQLEQQQQYSVGLETRQIESNYDHQNNLLQSTEVSVIAERYTLPPYSPSRFKSEIASIDNFKIVFILLINDIIAGSAQCHSARASRRGCAEEFLRASSPSSEGKGNESPLDPEKEVARNKLAELLQKIPIDYRLQILDAFDCFFSASASLGRTVDVLAQVLYHIDSCTRHAVEMTIGDLLPLKVKEAYQVMLKNAHKENHLDMLISQTSNKEFDILHRLVISGVSKWLKNTPQRERTFDRLVHDACIRRAWATIRWQADDPNLSRFDVELVAREVHTAWGRVIQKEWDIEVYGPPQSIPLRYTQQGHLDSINFQKASQFQCYLERLALAFKPYLLDDETFDYIRRKSSSPLTEQQKQKYRAIAEILINAFRIRFGEACQNMSTFQQDQDLSTQLMDDNIILPWHQHGQETDALRSRNHSPQLGPPPYIQELFNESGLSSFNQQADFGFNI
eukprot:gene3173-5916_t